MFLCFRMPYNVFDNNEVAMIMIENIKTRSHASKGYFMLQDCTETSPTKQGACFEGSRSLHKSTSDQVQKICGNCLVCERYAKNALNNRQSLDSNKREERQNPSSNHPIQYFFSPKKVPSAK